MITVFYYQLCEGVREFTGRKSLLRKGLRIAIRVAVAHAHFCLPRMAETLLFEGLTSRQFPDTLSYVQRTEIEIQHAHIAVVMWQRQPLAASCRRNLLDAKDLERQNGPKSVIKSVITGPGPS